MANVTLYTISFEPKQGVLMRMLTEVTRRGIDLDYIFVNAESETGLAIFRFKVTQKQNDQLLRAWRSSIGVIKADGVPYNEYREQYAISS